MDVDLSRYQVEKLEQCLKDFCMQVGADLAVLADETGQTVAAYGQARSNDFSTLATLAAANLAATVAIAAKVGERSACRTMLYEGENKRIYIAAAAQELVLLVVTGSSVPIGAVRFFLQRAGQAIEEILQSVPSGQEAEEVLGSISDLEAGFEQLFGIGLDVSGRVSNGPE